MVVCLTHGSIDILVASVWNTQRNDFKLKRMTDNFKCILEESTNANIFL